MKSNEVTISSKGVIQMKHDIELIKNHLLSETELTDWARKELEEARNAPRESYVSLEEMEKEFLKRCLGWSFIKG
jgi:hypothetical protein